MTSFVFRLFQNGLELLPVPASWPHRVTNLTPGTSYAFYAVVQINGLSAQSNEVTFCTTPEVPTAVHTTTRHFYGFEVIWNAPSAGDFSGSVLKLFR